MKHYIVNILDRVDNYLADKKSSERQVITFLPALLSAFLIYLYLFDPSIEALKKSQKELNTQKSTYQNYKTIFENNQMQKIITQISDQKREISSKITTTKEEIEGLKAQFINIGHMQMDWNDALKYITQKAKNHNIKLVKIVTDIKKKPSENTFNAFLKGDSDFKTLILFLNDLEVNDKFLRVSSGKISLDKNGVVFDINITSKKVVY